jgi:hypothetical protein
MQMTYGSTRHSPSGRKRKPLPKATRGKYKAKFEPLVADYSHVRDTHKYPSNVSAGGSTSVSDKRYCSSPNVIVGQAYNKGNLVVLTKDEAGDSRTGKRR